MKKKETEIQSKNALFYLTVGTLIVHPKKEVFLMFGCHNCGFRPEKNTLYSNSPCAKCRALEDPSLLSLSREDPSVYQEYSTNHPAYDDTQEEDHFRYKMGEVISALSQTIHIMVRLKEKYPETYRVVEAKMNYPTFSYAQLASMLDCRKQNIFYHLKRAMKFCPELSYALIIDSRYAQKNQLIRSRDPLSCRENKSGSGQ